MVRKKNSTQVTVGTTTVFDIPLFSVFSYLLFHEPHEDRTNACPDHSCNHTPLHSAWPQLCLNTWFLSKGRKERRKEGRKEGRTDRGKGQERNRKKNV